jgi:hypothetical protein
VNNNPWTFSFTLCATFFEEMAVERIGVRSIPSFPSTLLLAGGNDGNPLKDKSIITHPQW